MRIADNNYRCVIPKRAERVEGPLFALPVTSHRQRHSLTAEQQVAPLLLSSRAAPRPVRARRRMSRDSAGSRRVSRDLHLTRLSSVHSFGRASAQRTERWYQHVAISTIDPVILSGAGFATRSGSQSRSRRISLPHLGGRSFSSDKNPPREAPSARGAFSASILFQAGITPQ